MKISKSIRKQLAVAAGLYQNRYSGCYQISDLVPADVYPWEVVPLVRQWVSENCLCNHGQDITAFGRNLMIDAEDFSSSLWDEWEKYGFS